MSSKKIVVVFGATGVQGGSVINSLLKDPRTAEQFSLRAVTRDPSSAKAKTLTDRGVECVKGNLNSEEDLRRVFKGAYAAFAVTNYWEAQKPEVEEQQGKNIANAAKDEGLQHLIWSGLVHVTKLTNGEFKHVLHFDSKANVEEYINSIGIPATTFLPGFYMQNLAGGMIHPNPMSEEHEYVFTMPAPDHTPIPLFDAAEDTGKFVKAILLNREELLGKRVYAATAYYTCAQIVKEFAEVKPETGKTAHFNQIPDEQYKEFMAKNMHLDDMGATELLENMKFMERHGYFAKAPLEDSQKLLDEKPVTWKEFVAKAPQFKELK